MINWILSFGWNTLTFGPRRPIVCKPQVWSQDQPIAWRVTRFDLAELAKLRWIENWSRKDLARHFGKTETAIQQHFHKLKIRDFKVPGLDQKVRDRILKDLSGRRPIQKSPQK